MPSKLKQPELNMLREVIMGHQTMSCKFQDYANQCQDQQIKQMFQQAGTQASQSAQKLLQML